MVGTGTSENARLFNYFYPIKTIVVENFMTALTFELWKMAALDFRWRPAGEDVCPYPGDGVDVLGPRLHHLQPAAAR